MMNNSGDKDGFIIEEIDFGILDFDEPCEQQELCGRNSPQSQTVESVMQMNQASQQAFFKSERQIAWENKNRKIRAKVKDENGQILEIREVNRGAQFGFWDEAKKSQVYVHPQKDNTFRCGGTVLTRFNP